METLQLLLIEKIIFDMFFASFPSRDAGFMSRFSRPKTGINKLS